MLRWANLRVDSNAHVIVKRILAGRIIVNQEGNLAGGRNVVADVGGDRATQDKVRIAAAVSHKVVIAIEPRAIAPVALDVVPDIEFHVVGGVTVSFPRRIDLHYVAGVLGDVELYPQR